MDWYHAVVAGALGAFVGAGELVSRYRDAPGRALVTPSAALYLALNVGASLGSLALVRAFNWTFGAGDEREAAVVWTQVLVAGLGAMALLRSSLFLVRIGDQDVGIGPSGFIQVMLRAADAGVDRHRASRRAHAVQSIMAGVVFSKARVALPTLCLASLQNVSREDQEGLAGKVDALIRDTEMDDSQKSLALGLALINVAGEMVVKNAVRSLGESIRSGDVVPRP